MRNKLLRNQIGFTLIEVIVAIAISGILGGGIVTAMYQIGRVNDLGNAKVTAVKQLENSLYYINRDVQMAQSVQTDGEDYWLKLSWTNWENNHLDEVAYEVNWGVLTRSSYVDGTLVSSRPVAQYISYYEATPPDTETTPPEKAWTIEITATTTSGHRQANETRQLKIIPRPGS